MTAHATADLGAELTPRGSSSPRPDSPGRWAIFYILMPLLMAVPLGWFGAGIASQMTRPVGLLLWSVICCLSWWTSDLGTRALGLSLGRWRPHWMLLLVGGFAINLVLARYYTPTVLAALLGGGLVERTPMVLDYLSVERNLLDLHYVFSLAGSAVPGLLFWLAGNVAFERYGRTADVRPIVALPTHDSPDVVAALQAKTVDAGLPAEPSYLPPEPSSQPADPAVSPVPRFFQRLSRLAGLHVDELVAVEAEDHYVRVHSTRGKELVYYRFRDALEELDGVPGLQIHRSAWVGRRHIRALDGRGRKLEVVLVTGDRFNVSLSSHRALLQAGLR